MKIPKWFQSIGRWLAPRGRFLLHAVTSAPSEARAAASFELGPAGEKAAAKFLRKLGYRIIARSHRQRLGEIDLIALDGPCIVFVEVKTWRSDSEGDPSLAVNTSKQEKLTRAALVYLKQHRLLEQPARFDVVSIVWPTERAEPQIRHFKNAFEAVGRGQMFR